MNKFRKIIGRYDKSHPHLFHFVQLKQTLNAYARAGLPFYPWCLLVRQMCSARHIAYCRVCHCHSLCVASTAHAIVNVPVIHCILCIIFVALQSLLARYTIQTFAAEDVMWMKRERSEDDSAGTKICTDKIVRVSKLKVTWKIYAIYIYVCILHKYKLQFVFVCDCLVACVYICLCSLQFLMQHHTHSKYTRKRTSSQTHSSESVIFIAMVFDSIPFLVYLLYNFHKTVLMFTSYQRMSMRCSIFPWCSCEFAGALPNWSEIYIWHIWAVCVARFSYHILIFCVHFDSQALHCFMQDIRSN